MHKTKARSSIHDTQSPRRSPNPNARQESRLQGRISNSQSKTLMKDPSNTKRFIKRRVSNNINTRVTSREGPLPWTQEQSQEWDLHHKSNSKRSSNTQDQKLLQYKQSQTLKGKIPNPDKNSKVEFQTTRETSWEDLKPREKHKGRTPKPQEETSREESQHIKLKSKIFKEEKREDTQKCEIHEAKWEVASVWNNEVERSFYRWLGRLRGGTIEPT